MKDQLNGELGLTEQQIGMIFGAFALGYAIAQVPAGLLADKMGPRVLLTGVVILWECPHGGDRARRRIPFPAGDSVYLRHGGGRCLPGARG